MGGSNDAPDMPRGAEKTVLIVAPPGGDLAAREAVELVRCRSVDRLDWGDLAARLGELGQVDVVLVEAEGTSDEMLDAGLPLIDAFARAVDAGVIVSLDPRQIDVVASHLLGQRVQMLCEPTVVDLVAALALVALQADSALREGGGDVERLRRLAEEVARIGEALAELARVPGKLPPGVSEAGLSYGAPPRERAVTAADVRRAIRSRRLRESFFAAGLFEDPAWDMLLDLFAAELERDRVSVSSLCIAAAVAPTTALRWIGKMVESGLLERQADRTDKRRAFILLSDKAREAMDRYFAATMRQGLAIA